MWYHYYTKVNMVLLAFAHIRPNTIMFTCLWHNCLAVFTSYHAAFMIPGTWNGYLSQHNQTVRMMIIHNLVGHYAPIAYLYMKLCNQIDAQHSLECSLVSACFHLAWTWIVHGGLAMNDAYVKLTLVQWRMLWLLAVTTHITSGIMLPKLLQHLCIG